jgi:glycosyltransferase involved in cell wall biosynthesis
MIRNSGIDISAVATFHAEGLTAHRTLLGLERVRRYADQHGLIVQFVLVLDSADSETRRVIFSSSVLREADQIVEVGNLDLGASRNSGVAAARGDFIGIFDGDDFYSENWLVGALSTAKSKKGEVVVHPDYIVCFESICSIGRTLDMDRDPSYPLANCFSVHPWISCSVAKRQIYLDHPYLRTDTKNTGFGFEDWHWNLELLSDGVRHVVAPDSALFYRRKASSMLVDQLANKAIVRPNRFFAEPDNWESTRSDSAQKSRIAKKARL